MSKRNKKNRKNQPSDFPQIMRIPLSMEAMQQALGMTTPYERPDTPLIEELTATANRNHELVNRLWTSRSDLGSCRHGTMDGLMVSSLTPMMREMIGLDANGRYLGVSVVNECTRSHEMGIYDLESLKRFVNQLSEAIAAEERR